VTKFALLGALALVSAMAATPVTAQEVIYNPGYCAQFYPNANCQNKGPNNPYTGDYQLRKRAARLVCPWRQSLRAGRRVLSRPRRPPVLLLLRTCEAVRRWPALSFIGDTHLLNYPGIFGELIARHDAQFLGPSCRAPQPQVLELAANSGSPTAFTISAFSLATMSFGVPAGAMIVNQELKKTLADRIPKRSAHPEIGGNRLCVVTPISLS